MDKVGVKICRGERSAGATMGTVGARWVVLTVEKREIVNCSMNIEFRKDGSFNACS